MRQDRDGGVLSKPASPEHGFMSAILWFLAGLLAGAALMPTTARLWRALRPLLPSGRRALQVGGLTAVAAIAVAGGVYLTVNSRQGAAAAHGEPLATASSPPMLPASAPMPSASTMSRILGMAPTGGKQQAAPMDQAAAGLAARLERQGGTAADWNLLAQAYDFLGRADDARRARARAAQAGASQAAR